MKSAIYDYLYLTVALRLAGNMVDVPTTPIKSADDKNVWVYVDKEPRRGDPRRNYQRARADRERRDIIWMEGTGTRYPVGLYNDDTKTITVYETPFKLEKLQRVFRELCRVVHDRHKLELKVIRDKFAYTDFYSEFNQRNQREDINEQEQDAVGQELPRFT